MFPVFFSWKRCWAAFFLMSTTAYYNRPSNVVFIMLDDMGWNDVSFHGSNQIQTPNIDALAYQGVILKQYYSEAVCTPARTALLTGKYPMRLGMQGRPLANSEHRGIPLTERLLPSYLKELGYSTHLVGKWHVGMSMDEYLPTYRGYDTHYGMRGGFVDYYTYNKVEPGPGEKLFFGLDLFDDGIPQDTEQRYIVDALTDRAVKIIHQHNTSRPLFLHVTHNAPHAGNDGGKLQPPLYSSVKHKYIANSDRRLYADVVTHVDRSIGRLVTALADRNLLDDTIIAFVSDNGSPTVDEFSNWGVNLPLRGIKATPWEGAVRVPAFIWHADFRPRVWEGLMHITDWLPTLIAAAGGEFTDQIDGINQWDSIIQDGESKRQDVLITTDDSNTNAFAAYRAGDYKVVVGNVTGLRNGHYGAEFLINKQTPPEYFPNLRSCEVARVFSFMGKYFEYEEVEMMRDAATIKQLDTVKDSTPCLPTPNRGCLYNVKQDPAERHNLWDKASKVASLLTSRLRSLWAQQQRRGPIVTELASDPANFGYTWSPWVKKPVNNCSAMINEDLVKDSLKNMNIFATNGQIRAINTTVAGVINCNRLTYFRNFLCLLRSVL